MQKSRVLDRADLDAELPQRGAPVPHLAQELAGGVVQGGGPICRAGQLPLVDGVFKLTGPGPYRDTGGGLPIVPQPGADGLAQAEQDAFGLEKVRHIGRQGRGVAIALVFRLFRQQRVVAAAIGVVPKAQAGLVQIALQQRRVALGQRADGADAEVAQLFLRRPADEKQLPYRQGPELFRDLLRE